MSECKHHWDGNRCIICCTTVFAALAQAEQRIQQLQTDYDNDIADFGRQVREQAGEIERLHQNHIEDKAELNQAIINLRDAVERKAEELRRLQSELSESRKIEEHKAERIFALGRIIEKREAKLAAERAAREQAEDRLRDEQYSRARLLRQNHALAKYYIKYRELRGCKR